MCFLQVPIYETQNLYMVDAGAHCNTHIIQDFNLVSILI